jgi:hypothetical protein
MNIPGVQIIWWRRVEGGYVISDPSYAEGMIAEVQLPTLPGGSAKFYLPEESATLQAFLLGLDHGFELGAWHKSNEMRRMLGVSTFVRPQIKGSISNATGKL